MFRSEQVPICIGLAVIGIAWINFSSFLEDLLYKEQQFSLIWKAMASWLAISYRTYQNLPVTCDVTRHHAPAPNVVIGTSAVGAELHLK
jgi:hypothetical protein